MNIYNEEATFAPIHIILESKLEVELLLEALEKSKTKKREVKDFIGTLMFKIRIHK